jgi:hypothetical protein
MQRTSIDPRRIAAALALSVLCAPAIASAATVAPDVTAAPAALAPLAHQAAADIWLIDTRPAFESQGGEEPRYHRRGPHGWRPASCGEFQAADEPDVPTCIWVPGNRSTLDSGRAEGEQLCQALCDATSRPVRLVIWSWPSDPLPGQIHDLRVKALRADRESWSLARFVSRMAPDVEVSLLGYSFGTRVVAGCLHLLGSGEIAGRRLDDASTGPLALRAVLVASALDCQALGPGGQFCEALAGADQLIVTVNPTDPVLRLYPHLWGPLPGPEALGRVGPSALAAGDAGMAELLWIAPAVGKSHAWQRHLHAPGLVEAVLPVD